MAKQIQRSTLSEDEAFTEITSIQPAIDRVRFAAINRSGKFSVAKKKSLLRQEKSAVARFGANSPEVAGFRRRLQSEERFAVAVKAEAERAQVEPMQRNPGALTMRGRVVNAQRLGIATLTVSAIDRSGRAAASAVTSETGYYEFLVPVTNQKGPALVTLLVNDSAKNILYRGCECFEVKPNAVVNRELVLGSAEPIPQPTRPPEVDVQRVTVPDVRGLNQIQAERQLDALCLQHEVTLTGTRADRAGKVLEQNPAPGTTVLLGSVVNLTVGNAVGDIEVPDLVGLTQDEAQSILKEGGLSVGMVTFERRDDLLAGTVVSQNPEAGARVAAGAPVDLVIATGETAVRVPGVVEQKLAEARTIIVDSRLRVGTVEPEDSRDESVVVAQSPEEGTQVPTGTLVNMKVGPSDSIPLEVEVPDLSLHTVEEAQKRLVGSRLTLGEVSTRPADSDAFGRVIGQNPKAGTRVAEQSAVSIVVGARTIRALAPGSLTATEIIAHMAAATDFGSVGAGEAKLARLAEENKINSARELATFLDRDDRDVRDLFRLPNLNAAQAFKRVLRSALD